MVYEKSAWFGSGWLKISAFQGVIYQTNSGDRNGEISPLPNWVDRTDLSDLRGSAVHKKSCSGFFPEQP
jgi:hypothetical protein